MNSIYFGGKIFVFGEWSILRPGAVAGLLYIDKQVELQIQQNEGESLDIYCVSGKREEFLSYKNKKIIKASDKSFLSLLIEELNAIKPSKTGSIKIITKDDSQKWGFGSSAAIKLSLMYFLEQTNKEILKRYCLDQNKSGSGADIASLASKENIFYFSQSETESTEKLTKVMPQSSAKLRVLIAKPLGKPQRTEKTVEEIRNKNNYYEILDQLERLNKQIYNDWNRVNARELIKSLRELQDLLSQLGIVPEITKQFNLMAKEHNILLKSCGAGGNDAHLLFCEDEMALDYGKKLLLKHGFMIYDSDWVL